MRAGTCRLTNGTVKGAVMLESADFPIKFSRVVAEARRVDAVADDGDGEYYFIALPGREEARDISPWALKQDIERLNAEAS